MRAPTTANGHIWALCAVLMAIAVVGYWGSNSRLLGPPLGPSLPKDARAYVRAGADLTAGRSLYDRALTYGNRPEIGSFLGWDEGTSYYVYPPVLAVLTAPLAFVSEGLVIRLWISVSMLLIAASALMVLAMVSEGISVRGPAWSSLAIIIFFTFYPTQNVLQTGNIDALILFLLTLTYWSYRRRHPAAALAFAAAIAIKPQLALLSAFFLWKGQWRFVFAAAVVTAGLVVASFGVAGWHQFWDYMDVNRAYTVGAVMRAYPVNQSTHGAAIRLFTENDYIQPLFVAPFLAQLIPIVVGLLAAAAWVTTMSARDNRERPSDFIEFGFTITTMTLVLPYLGENQLLWLLMPLTGMLFASLQATRIRNRVVFSSLTLLLLLYLGFPDLHDAIWKGWEARAFEGRLVDQRYLLFAATYVYGLIPLSLLTMLYLRRARSAPWCEPVAAV